jgi:glyoxalase family protein
VALADADALPGWSGGDVDSKHAIRAIRGVTLWVAAGDSTGAVLSAALGFTEAGREGNFVRFIAGNGQHAPVTGGVVDLRVVGDFLPGRTGAGSVHHVAFRAADDKGQARMTQRLAGLGIQATAQMDRNYFRSVYFREPSGVIFEIATDAPGFSADEAPTALGESLKLPAWLEPRRREIERALPSLEREPALA